MQGVIFLLLFSLAFVLMRARKVPMCFFFFFFIIRQRYLEYFRFHIRCGGMIFNTYGSVELQVYV